MSYTKALVAYVFNKPFGANKEGDVIQLDPEEAQPLVDADVLSEATEEHVNGDNPEADPAADDTQNAALTRAVSRLSKDLEGSIAKATELAVSKNRNVQAPTVPATVAGDVFRCPGEMILHAWKAAKERNATSKNMLAAHQKSIRLKSPLGQQESVNQYGGYDVKPEWYDKVWDKVRDYPKLIDLCTKIPAKSSTFNIPAISENSMADGQRHGGIQAFYVGEGNNATASTLNLGQVSANLHKLVILNYCTLEILQDANIEAIDKLVYEMAMKELIWKQNDGIINGAGTTAPLGILNQASLITVAKDGNDVAAGFSFADLARMLGRLYAASADRAVWLVNPAAYSTLMLMTFPNAASSSTYPAWSLTYSGHDAFPMKLFNLPVIKCMNMAQLGNVGDILLADLSQVFVYERPGIQVDVSDDVAFTSLQTAFRFVYRWDVCSPWVSALTPAVGGSSYTTSAFVTLQSRGT